MRYKVGDRVKFLTEAGGGIIRKVVGPNLVNVETEDGFEIPTLTRDLILIEAGKSAAEKLFVKQMDQKDDLREESEAKKEVAEEDAFQSDALTSSLIVYPSDRKPEQYNLSVVFVPQHQNVPVAGDLDIYLMNYSANDVMFSYHNQYNGVINLVCSGKIAAFSKYFVANIKREELDAFLNANVQVLVLHQQSRKLHAPVSADMQIKGSKFYKENSYKHDNLMHQKALMYQLFSFKNIPVVNQLSVVEDVVTHQSVAKERKKSDAILKHKTSKNKAVVDMHIWELVDDHSRMTSQEIFNVQLGYFEKCLYSAIDHNFKSVVFIHGVGTGKLKEEIMQILDEKDNLNYRPASMAEYGVGATQVDILGEED